MRKILFLILVSLLVLISCEVPNSETSNGTDSETTYSLAGAVQKGPFQINSSISIQEVDNRLVPTGRIYTTSTNTDLGAFSLSSKFNSNLVEVTCQGFYFNECINATTDGMLTLKTFGDLSSGKPLNINVLTTITHDRVRKLVESGLSFSEATVQAESELLASLNLNAIGSLEFQEFNLESTGNDASLLLAVSASLQQGRSISTLSLLIADIAGDLADDGVINETQLLKIRTSATAVNASLVRQNLQNHYAGRGKSITVPDFSSYQEFLKTAVLGVGTPVFSNTAGTYIEDLSITISTIPNDAQIFYTLDSTDPTVSSTLYTGAIPVTIGSDITIKAIGIREGVQSSIAQARYIVKDGRYASDYWKTDPGLYIEYQTNAYNIYYNLSTPAKMAMVFQECTDSRKYLASFSSSLNTYTNINFQRGPYGSSHTGFSGGSMDNTSAFFLYAYLKDMVIAGETYYSSFEPISFTSSLVPSWNGYTDLVRLDLHMENASFEYRKGTGYILFARDIGVVYLEFNHTAGTYTGDTVTWTILNHGTTAKYQISGVYGTDGSSAIGNTLAISLNFMLPVLPATSYINFVVDGNFTLSAFAREGTYLSLALFPTGQDTGNSNKNVAIGNDLTIDVGDFTTYTAP